MTTTAVHLLLPLLCLVQPLLCWHIILLPREDVDILLHFSSLAHHLLQHNHRVTVIADQRNPDIENLFPQKVSFLYHKYLQHKRKDSIDYLYSDEKYEAVYVEQYLKKELTEQCMQIVYSDDLYERIKLGRFDIAVVDSSIFCYHVIPYKLKIPWISMGSSVYPYLMRMHPLLSVEPCLMKEDTFLTRMYRLVSGIYGEIQPKLLIEENQFTHAIPGQRFSSLRELGANSSLWFVIKDPALDCPLPVSPGVFQLGPMTTPVTSSLPSYTKKFVDSSDRGIAVLWFSHSLRNLTARIQDKFSATFRKSGLIYLWHRDNTSMPDNVRTVQNVPLDNLLQLKRTKLLITDCNTYTVSKAIRYAVPILCMPILGEHRYNTYRVHTRAIGVHLDIRKFQADNLAKKIRTLTKNDKYSKNIKKLSAMQRNFPDPGPQAVFWIEYIVKFGNSNLRTSAQEQSLYHFLMIDIYLATFAISIMLAYLVKYSMKILLNTRLAKKIIAKLPGSQWLGKKKSDQPTMNFSTADEDGDDEREEEEEEEKKKCRPNEQPAQNYCRYNNHYSSHHPQHGKDNQRSDHQRHDHFRSDTQRSDHQRSDHFRSDTQRSDHQRSDHFRSDTQRSDHQRSDHFRSDTQRSDHQRSDHFRSENQRSDHVRSDNQRSDHVRSDNQRSDHVRSDHMRSDPQRPKTE